MKKKPSNFSKRVYAVVAKIPKGKVMTYGEVAKKAGKPTRRGL
jgi:alkylated DNA nucleotide flippase Atl1